jgi:hypothetical protein
MRTSPAIGNEETEGLMTTERRSLEVPEADMIEQDQQIVPVDEDVDPEAHARSTVDVDQAELPFEASAADVVDQRREVAVDDDDFREDDDG